MLSARWIEAREGYTGEQDGDQGEDGSFPWGMETVNRAGASLVF